MDPEELRRLLWEAAVAGDETALENLCRTHRETITQAFPSWRTVPAEIRNNPSQVEGYVQIMAAIGRIFAQRLNDSSLLQSLMGQPQENPLVQWQQKLDQAQKGMEELRYAEMVDLLNDVLIDVRGMKGSGVDVYLPVTYGLLGECYFQNGEAQKAVTPTERALELCRHTGDRESEATYLGNLYEIHRYLGDAARAANAAEQLAECLQQQGQVAEAERYSRQAALVRRGEPLNRVIVNVDDRRLELDEVLQGTQGRVQFVFERNRLTLRRASELTHQGERQASQGRFEAALKLFRQAADLDRFDPHCHYQAALTLLYLQRYAEAVQEYDTTEQLAPGWFQCRANGWLARQMLAGKVSQEVFQFWHLIEEGPLNPQQKLNLLENALKLQPDLAVLHLLEGKSRRDLGQAAAAEAAYRKGLTCAQEPDVKSRLLVNLGAVVNDPNEKKRLLQEAIELNGNLVATAMAKVVLAFE